MITGDAHDLRQAEGVRPAAAVAAAGDQGNVGAGNDLQVVALGFAAERIDGRGEVLTRLAGGDRSSFQSIVPAVSKGGIGIGDAERYRAALAIGPRRAGRDLHLGGQRIYFHREWPNGIHAAGSGVRYSYKNIVGTGRQQVIAAFAKFDLRSVSSVAPAVGIQGVSNHLQEDIRSKAGLVAVVGIADWLAEFVVFHCADGGVGRWQHLDAYRAWLIGATQIIG